MGTIGESIDKQFRHFASITKPVSENEDLTVTPDDLYEDAAKEVPKNLLVIYSIKGIPSLTVTANNKTEEIKDQGRLGVNPADYQHKLIVLIEGLKIEAGFKEDQTKSNVKSGLGRVLIYKEISN